MNPYESLPAKAFWKNAIAGKNLFDIDGLWDPKAPLRPQQKIATFGSCFAQHIGRTLKERGYCWMNTEPPPFGLSPEDCKSYNYNIFSSRTGNIYTTSLLRQWVEWALGVKSPPEECWEKDGRYYDPFRPNIEPNGFASVDELLLSRQQTIKSFKNVIIGADVFIFTLGLTESWFNKEHGYEYPLCPGTLAGTFDANLHTFTNQQFNQIITSLISALDQMIKVNQRLRFILTVSPVPLTATCSGKHVLTATMESKSVLRAVAGQLAANRGYVDYFPSYEIINSPPFRGVFFEPNQRSVNLHGVDFVMDSFFSCLSEKFGRTGDSPPGLAQAAAQREEADVVCEEELLSAFGTKR